MQRTIRQARRAIFREAIYPIRSALIRRRFHAFGIGTPKSGTHSIAAIFARYRTAHQPMRKVLNEIILDQLENRAAAPEIARRVREWDQSLWLEMIPECNTYFLLDTLLAEFPDSRYILTIRDPYTWLDSLFNHIENYGDDKLKRSIQNQRIEAIQFKDDRYTLAPEEAVLEGRNRHTLDGFFSYWAEHNQTVIDRVPPERLLIVRTPDIRTSIAEMAAFLRIDPAMLVSGRAHEFRATKKLGLLQQIDRDFLESKVNTHCRPLLDRFYPDIKSLDDAMGKGSS